MICVKGNSYEADIKSNKSNPITVTLTAMDKNHQVKSHCEH